MFTQSGKRAVVTSRGIREQDLQKQVTLTKSQLRDLRMSHETNQAKLLDQSQRQGTHNHVAMSGTHFTPMAPTLTRHMHRPGGSCQTCGTGHDSGRLGTCEQPCGHG